MSYKFDWILEDIFRYIRDHQNEKIKYDDFRRFSNCNFSHHTIKKKLRWLKQHNLIKEIKTTNFPNNRESGVYISLK